MTIAILFMTIIGHSQVNNDSCICKLSETKKIVLNKTFNKLPEYDSSNFTLEQFYQLDRSANRKLWFRDIENIGPTKFTKLWQSFSRDNYFASNRDFINHYEGKKDVELAFQFGPDGVFNAYDIYVVKRIGGCYLITRSYFPHGRFTYKAYALMDAKAMDNFFSVVKRLPTQRIPSVDGSRNRGYFVDNRYGGLFSIDFDADKATFFTNAYEQSWSDIEALYDFINRNIRWIKTYSQ